MVRTGKSGSASKAGKGRAGASSKAGRGKAGASSKAGKGKAGASSKAGTKRTKASSKVEAAVARNPRARHEYHILEVCEAGIALTGAEVKSLRERQASIAESYAKIRGGEAFIVGMTIPPYRNAAPDAPHEQGRTRKLLLHRTEIRRLAGKLSEKGTTMVPLSVYFRRGWAKVELALVKAKREYDKRETIKKREQRREMDRAKKRRR